VAENPKDLINLADPAIGGAICSVSDEFFAPAKRMLSVADPVFIEDLYDANGKWMDGWESRRKRSPGHDFCIIRICPGVIREIEVDTANFTGNFAPAFSIEACNVAIEPDDQTQWTELVSRSALQGDKLQDFAVSNNEPWTHLRINIFPDGGIARLRVYGEPTSLPDLQERDQWVNLSCSDAGGEALACNNMHYGDMANLLSMRPVANMGDGWETRRRREPGNDWVILKLGRRGRVMQVQLDTAFFRGNYPARCCLRGGSPAAGSDVIAESSNWPLLLNQVALGPDQLHLFESQLLNIGDITHVRLDIFPDGGVARLHLTGIPA
jgi:allantoicase